MVEFYKILTERLSKIYIYINILYLINLGFIFKYGIRIGF